MALEQRTVAEVTPGVPERLPAIDVLRAFLVAWIIAGHALLGYTAVGGWMYSHIAEVHFAPRVEWILAAVIGSTGVFLVGTFFLIAGVFTSEALARTTSRQFLVRRVLRLGLPFAAMVVLLWPVAKWMAFAASGRTLTWHGLLTGYRHLSSGAGWFLLVLLILSVAYLGWRVLVPGPHGSLVLHGRHLVLAAVAIAVSSFVVRLWLPAHTREFADLHVWAWPQLVGPFLLGAACGRRLVIDLPDSIYRGTGRTALATVVSIPAAAVLLGIDNVADAAPRFVGGWHWESATMAVVHGVLAVAGSVWLLGFAQRHVDGTGRVARASARASFTAFLMQSPVLMGLALSLRSTDLPAEFKAPLVASAAVLVCFGLGHVIVTRSRLARIL